jgi:predicted metal-dependent phosphoesterase TrpH
VAAPRIDLHLHTTSSDGALAPADLVARAAAAGLTVISVTDHDTLAGLDSARDAARQRGMRLIDGIEVTAVEAGRDVHVLGYFFDPAYQPLAVFLGRQREARIARVRQIGERLEALKCPVDVAAILAEAARHPGRSVGRPSVADALVAAGHAVDRRDAFDRLLGTGGPAFVPRCGPTVAEVVDVIAAAGGITSLAHPGLTRVDADLPRFVDAGLAALEARHRDHSPATEAHYRALAAVLGIAVSAGSDFHGLGDRDELGDISLDAGDLAALEALVPRRRVAADATPGAGAE